MGSRFDSLCHMTKNMKEQDKSKEWTSKLLLGFSYAVAVILTLASPTLIGSSLLLAVIWGEASVLGFGLLAGTLLGTVGAAALMWCLTTSRSMKASA